MSEVNGIAPPRRPESTTDVKDRRREGRVDTDNPHLVELFRAKPSLDAIDPESAHDAVPPASFTMQRSSMIGLAAACALFWGLLLTLILRT